MLPSQNGCGIAAEDHVGKEERCPLPLGEHPSTAIIGLAWRALQHLKLTYIMTVPLVGMCPASTVPPLERPVHPC